MSDRLDDDLLDDLLDEPEGRAHGTFDELEEAEGADDLEEFDELEEGPEHLEEADELESEAEADEFEEAMTDALEAEDDDEFFGGFMKTLRKIGRGVGSVARVVAPIASAIPIPQAQLIGRAANLIGDVLADEGDEMDALDELADSADDEDAMVKLAPAVATLAIRKAVRQIARVPRPQRRQVVRAVTAATRHVVRAHGPRAIAAMPAIVHHARRIAVRHRLPISRLPQLIRRTAAAAVRSPQVARKLVQTAQSLRAAPSVMRRGMGRRRHRYGRGYAGGMGIGTMRFPSGRAISGGGLGAAAIPRGMRRGVHAHGGGVCPVCSRRRSFSLQGPVRVTIEPA
jgi:hypothetical protein